GYRRMRFVIAELDHQVRVLDLRRDPRIALGVVVQAAHAGMQIVKIFEDGHERTLPSLGAFGDTDYTSNRCRSSTSACRVTGAAWRVSGTASPVARHFG